MSLHRSGSLTMRMASRTRPICACAGAFPSTFRRPGRPRADRPAPRTALPRPTTAPWHRNSGRLRGETRRRQARLPRLPRARRRHKVPRPLRPALGQHPAPGVAAGDEHNLDAVFGLAPGQRRNLQTAGRLPKNRRTLSTRWLFVSAFIYPKGLCPPLNSFAVSSMIGLIV